MYARVFSNHYILLLLQKYKQFITIYSISSFHTPPSMLSSSHHHAPFITRFLYVKAKRRLPYSPGRFIRSLSRWKSILRKRTVALTSFTIGRLPCWSGKILHTKGHHHWQPQSRKAHPTGLCTYILILLGSALCGLATMSARMAPVFFAMKAKQRYPKNQIQSPS